LEARRQNGCRPSRTFHQHGAVPLAGDWTRKGGDVLGVGIDWSTEYHVVAFGRADKGVFKIVRVAHEPEDLLKLVGTIAELEPDASEVRVVLETSHGSLVEHLVDAGYVVLPVNPDVLARRRGPAKKKDDTEDARIACELALDRFSRLRPLIPHSPIAAELRSIARDDDRAAQDEHRLVVRLRQDLAATFPAALGFASRDLGRPTFLHILERWPTHEELAAASRDEIEDVARKAHHGSPGRMAQKVADALAQTHFVARDHLVRAKADTIRLTARQLLAIDAQRRAWERRMGVLLLGVARDPKTHKPRQGPRAEALPGGEIYLSFPGLGDRLAARVAGEIGDIQGFETPNNLQCYAGKAPVTRRSGKRELTVVCRYACNGHLRNAVQAWAFSSITASGWAREFYDQQRARGKSHHAALRALGNRWLEILWHCLRRGVCYEEATHVANRNRALGRTA
jgi:transposase